MDTMSLKNKVNKKFIIGFIVIVLIIASIILFLEFRNFEKTNNTITTFTSNDSAFSLSLYDSFGFTECKDNDYVLELKSDKSNAGIYVSKVSTNNIRNIQKYIEADKNYYISKFSNISQVSEISEYTLQSLPVYNYHFNYKDSMYVDVYWILKDSDFYVIDFSIDKSTDDLTYRIGEILNSLKFN